MGKDIHMFIVYKGNIIKSNIYTGRNSSWFRNLCGYADLNEYNYLPIVFGWGELAPQELSKRYTKERGYFDHCHIKVKFFKEWFEKCRPDIQAGWATTYEVWAIKNKGYNPGYLPTALTEDMIIEDMQFIEYSNTEDNSSWLYDFLIENKINDNADIIYCFDN